MTYVTIHWRAIYRIHMEDKKDGVVVEVLGSDAINMEREGSEEFVYTDLGQLLL